MEASLRQTVVHSLTTPSQDPDQDDTAYVLGVAANSTETVRTGTAHSFTHSAQSHARARYMQLIAASASNNLIKLYVPGESVRLSVCLHRPLRWETGTRRSCLARRLLQGSLSYIGTFQVLQPAHARARIHKRARAHTRAHAPQKAPCF
jgi:hypothetical protein